mmetsp:Transcript_80905/g.142720  ORF Transcript_80905/g.142720 Transcript_80905/m.142720 type:complete len:172 (-) Transcript_80905:146-661(-)
MHTMSMHVRSLQSLVAFLFASALTAEAKLTKDSHAFTMLGCDACKIVMGRLAPDLKFLTETAQIWPQSVLEERLALACDDPKHPTGAGVEACNLFISEYHKSIVKEVKKRWDENSEEFEEDIVPAVFCTNIVSICKEGKQSLNEMMAFSERKEKLLKEEKEEKERAAKSKS